MTLLLLSVFVNGDILYINVACSSLMFDGFEPCTVHGHTLLSWLFCGTLGWSDCSILDIAMSMAFGVIHQFQGRAIDITSPDPGRMISFWRWWLATWQTCWQPVVPRQGSIYCNIFAASLAQFWDMKPCQEEQQWALVQWLTSGANLDWFLLGTEIFEVIFFNQQPTGPTVTLFCCFPRLPEWGPKKGPLLEAPPAGCSDVGESHELGPFFGRISLIRTPPGGGKEILGLVSGCRRFLSLNKTIKNHEIFGLSVQTAQVWRPQLWNS